MSVKNVSNIAASVKARLMNFARERKAAFNVILIRYANERFLYRLGISRYRDNFVLKGSNLFLIWQNGYPYRPTIDADFLVIGQSDREYLKTVFAELCRMKVTEHDGLTFDATTINATEIREEAQYGGTRIELTGLLGAVKVYLQFDIGIGDAVTPAPELSEYPVILDFAAPQLQIYPQVTAIAEKTKTMVTLGVVNSRMKDFADILVLQRNFSFDYDLLKTAVNRTFERYGVEMPLVVPMCFSSAFASSPAKQTQWTVFCRKAGITDLPTQFSDVVSECESFLLPLLFPPSPLPIHWKNGQGWLMEK